jgi:radical SAM protein (TIGR01212 family)
MNGLSKHYHTANAYFQSVFGEKVHRVSIDAGFSCPNRDGTKGIGGCIYCNEAGSRARYVEPEKSVRDQVLQGIDSLGKKFDVRKFIAYFQAYSNTYADVSILGKIYSEALDFPEIVGISIGTRPDCINSEKLALIEKIAEEKWVMVEYGAQTMKNQTLELINRGHSVNETISAIQETKKRKNIQVLAHLIFGLPGEDFSDMKQSVKELVDLGVDAFKFHHLYVEKNTALEIMLNKGQVRLLKLEEYLELLCDIIPNLPERIVLHRLFGECAKENLIAPIWTLEKNKNLALLGRLLAEKNIRQGGSHA